MKKRRNPNLISLYISYIFQKTTILIFGISLLLMLVVLFLLTNPWMEKDAYILNPLGYHQAYLEQGTFVISIFNGILVTTVTITIVLQSNSFDTLFIANTKRTRISISKVVAALLIFLLLSIFEYSILYGYPILFYNSFTIDYTHLWAIYYFFIEMTFLFAVGSTITILIPSIFTPMLILFLSIVKSLLASSFGKIKDTLSIVVPILESDGYSLQMESKVTSVFLILLFVLLYVSLYNTLDLKQT